MRRIFTRFKVGAREYSVSDFLIISGIMVVLLPFYYQGFKFFSEPRFWIYFLMMVGFVVIGSVTFLRAYKLENVTQLEPLRIFGPFISMMIALLFFQQEVQTADMALLLVAGLALVYSQGSLTHIRVSRGSIWLLISITAYAFEPFFVKEIVDLIDPFSLFLVRAIGVFILSYIIFRPTLVAFQKKLVPQLIFQAVMSTTKKLILFAALVHLHVLHVVLILMLKYPLDYLFARTVLKEKIPARNIIGSLIILAAVIIRQFV